MVIEIESVEGDQLEEIAAELAIAIKVGSMNTLRTKELLLAFAEEIKRQAIEP